MTFDLVLFGGTGDLAWRKLMPALFQAFRHGKPARGRPHHRRGARRPAATTQYRELIQARFDEVERRQAAQRRGVRALRRAAALPAHGPVASRDDYARPGRHGCDARNADTVVMYLATAPAPVHRRSASSSPPPA